MSDLLLMSPPGLPRTGLVGLYDPYRDAYGRNILPTDANPFGVSNAADLSIAAGEADSAGGATGIKLTEKATTSVKYCQISSSNAACVSGAKYAYVFDVKPAGVTKVRIYPWVTAASKGYVDFDLSGSGAIHATSAGTCVCSGTITALSDGWYRLTFSFTADATGNFVYGVLHMDDSWNISFLGSADRSLYVSKWQKTFNAVMPYSAPAGAPGTLQVVADYYGGLYPLQLGSGATGDASDPAFTGVSMLHAGDYLLSGNIANLTMAGDWSIPILLKPSGTSGVIVSLADAAHADQYQAIEYNGSTKVRIKTCNGASPVTSSDLTVSASAVQMLSLVSSGDTLTLKLMNTGTSVTATNADPTGTPRLCIGALGVSTVGSPADALEWHMLPPYRRALTVMEETRIYRYAKSLMAERGVTVA